MRLAVRRALIVIALSIGACGDDVIVPPDAAIECGASLRGNTADEVRGPKACAEVAAGVAESEGDVVVRFALPSTALASTVGIEIDVGAAPATGTYTPATSPRWSALAIREVGSGACTYIAGSMQTPPGTFTLTLDRIDPAARVAHGALTATLSVLAYLGSDCGDIGTETVDIRF